MSEQEITLPNPDMLAITRLYLEKRDTLTAEERTIFLSLIQSMTTPVLRIKQGSIPLSSIGEQITSSDSSLSASVQRCKTKLRDITKDL
jgi:hypothetical protein